MPHLKKAATKDLIDLYSKGFSCQVIANSYCMSRQAVWERLNRNGIVLRKKNLLPFVMYGGIKFTISSSTGYYRNTDRTSRGLAISLHRYKYELEVEKIPSDWDVHHIDFDKTNNEISNLISMSKSDHARLHARARKA